MKKVINGSVYDTDTAKKLAEDRFGNQSDFHHWEEALYRTKSGRYFLHGEGGAASKYAVCVGQNEWCGGEKIIPLDIDAAQRWAEEHLDGDEYEAAFGVPDEVPRITIALTPENRKKLECVRAKNGMTFVEIINDAIAAYQNGG